jgi:hypothetical protein
MRSSAAIRCAARAALGFIESVEEHPVEFSRAAWVLVFDTDGEG